MDLHVATWFHREARTGHHATGWTRGLQAFPDLAQALEAGQLHRALALELAGESEADAGRRAQDLGCSTVEVVSYALAGPLTLELLALVVSSPPGSRDRAFDPLAQGSTWWRSAPLAWGWWGGG